MNDQTHQLYSAVSTSVQKCLDDDRKNGVDSIQKFRDAGGSIADWARANGFSVRLTYAIYRQERKCLRGESLKIAKGLGMK